MTTQLSKLTRQKIGKFKTKLPDKSAFTIETESDFPKLHTLTVASGKRGGGKSVAVANFVRECRQRGYYDRVLLITPTYASNKSIWDICEIDEEDVYEPTVGVLRDIIKIIEAEREEWDLFLAKKEVYKQYKNDMKNKPVDKIPEDDMLMYLELGYLDREQPTWKYKKEVPPRLGLIIDDAMGTDLYRKPSAGLTKFLIAHRHQGDGLGISVFMLVQSYCSKDGVPRPVRENTTHLMLFRISDEKQIAKVKEECDLPITADEWNSMCSQAHAKPFNFLYVDFSPKCKQKMFRDGFDEYIKVPSLKCECNKK